MHLQLVQGNLLVTEILQDWVVVMVHNSGSLLHH
jgi:hypothetical protein